jgi:hypothetical protein
MSPRLKPTTSTDPNVHPKTLARKVTTTEQVAPRPAPSVQAILADQKADQTIDRSGNVVKTAAPLPVPPVQRRRRSWTRPPSSKSWNSGEACR